MNWNRIDDLLGMVGWVLVTVIATALLAWWAYR